MPRGQVVTDVARNLFARIFLTEGSRSRQVIIGTPPLCWSSREAQRGGDPAEGSAGDSGSGVDRRAERQRPSGSDAGGHDTRGQSRARSARATLGSQSRARSARPTLGRAARWRARFRSARKRAAYVGWNRSGWRARFRSARKRAAYVGLNRSGWRARFRSARKRAAYGRWNRSGWRARFRSARQRAAYGRGKRCGAGPKAEG